MKTDTQEFNNVHIDSIITIPRHAFDTIVKKELTVPQNIESVSKCYGCAGTLWVNFKILNSHVIESLIIRGINPKMDSILFAQNKIVFDILMKYSNFEVNKTYLITIAVRFEYVDGDDNIIVVRHDSIGGRKYIIQKSKIDIRFKTDTTLRKNIPQNIVECITQLDSELDVNSKNKILFWDEDFFHIKADMDVYFHNWINNNWKISCGWSINPKNEKAGLEKYFDDLGIKESCYISFIISSCYYHHLTTKGSNFKEIIEFYKKKQNNN